MKTNRVNSEKYFWIQSKIRNTTIKIFFNRDIDLLKSYFDNDGSIKKT